MIIITVRTRDEEHRIAQFCTAYKDADMIIVSDGGSLDRTVEIASTFSNVNLIPYNGRVQLEKNHWRNNDSDHANWLFFHARTYNPDWIIYDDCDCRPNHLLKQDYRKILSETKCDYVMVTRLYLWGIAQHFPHMCKPEEEHKRYEPSLWAFRGNQDFWTVDVPPAYTFRIGNKDIKDLHLDAKTLDLFPPYCLLHYSWDDEDRVNKKITIYRESGLIPSQLHPLVFAGPLEDLPEWARE